MQRNDNARDVLACEQAVQPQGALRYLLSPDRQFRWQANAGEPPTLAALKAPAYASERQVADFVAQLRGLGLVTAIPLPTDHRMAALHPSPRLITEISRHPRLMAQLYASLAEPDALAAADPDTTQMLDLMVRATTVATQQELSELSEPPFPIVDHFARHDGGYLILMTVLRAHYRLGDAGMDLAYGALASRFGISLAHVGKLMREARCAGWFKVPRGGAPCAVSSALVRQFEHFLAEQAAHFGTLALPQSSIRDACTL